MKININNLTHAKVIVTVALLGGLGLFLFVAHLIGK